MKLPNLIIDTATGDVIAFGYCDFTPQLQPGQEQVQCLTEQLPPIPGAAFPTLDRYRYDSETGSILIVEE